MSKGARSDVAAAGRRLKSRIYVALLCSSVLPVVTLTVVAHVYVLPLLNPMDSVRFFSLLGLLFVVATALGGLGRWWGGLASLLNSLSGWETGVFAALAAVGQVLLQAEVLYFLYFDAPGRAAMAALVFLGINALGTLASLAAGFWTYGLAVLVALVKLSSWAKIIPGPGLFAFTLVVVFTMLASATFDPKLIWQRR